MHYSDIALLYHSLVAWYMVLVQLFFLNFLKLSMNESVKIHL